MNGFHFRKAIREAVGLIIGLIGPSGGGKTYTAMRLAKGIVGEGNRFAVIDTEAGRAKHYADLFNFDHGDLKPPFRPDAYSEAIKAADEAGYKVIIVDSASLEWAGEGGILEWQEEELNRMAGDDWKKREACKMASWIKPKMSHKKMIQKFLQIRAHLILCFRAEERNEIGKDAQGKMTITPKGFQPVCSKEMPYELTVSFLLTPDKPGIPQPIKLQEQHKILFPLNKQIGEESGKLISEWATGKKESQVVESPNEPTEEQALEDVKNAGMTPLEGEATDSPNSIKKAVLSFQTRKEVMDYYNKNRSDWKKNYSPATFGELTKIVNDRLEQFK